MPTQSQQVISNATIDVTDTVTSSLMDTTTDLATTVTTLPPETVAVLPLTLLLGYGISRAASVGFSEYRNAIFAYVAQDAIRTLGVQTFRHVIQNLDLQYHLSRNTGQLSRILDRGQRSISFLLNAMVFNVVPTILMKMSEAPPFLLTCGPMAIIYMVHRCLQCKLCNKLQIILLPFNTTF